MEKTIELQPQQIAFINKIASEKDSIIQREKDLLTFILLGAGIDPNTKMSLEIVGNTLKITP